MPILSPLHDPGTVISTAQGDTPNSNTPETRIQQFELAGRLSRCARMIDDVLFIDVSPEEQQWALKRIYKPDDTGLNTTEECAASPQRVMHLDMEILEDTSSPRPIHHSLRQTRRARGEGQDGRGAQVSQRGQRTGGLVSGYAADLIRSSPRPPQPRQGCTDRSRTARMSGSPL